MPQTECLCGCPVTMETLNTEWRMLDLDYWSTPDNLIDTDRLGPEIDAANAIVVWCPVRGCLSCGAYRTPREGFIVALGHHIQSGTHNPHIHAFMFTHKVNGS